MCELDQQQPTTSEFHLKVIPTDETNVKRKRLRMKREYSIFVEGDAEKRNDGPNVEHRDENKDEHVFKYPGELRGIKRRRNITNQRNIRVKRKTIEHQITIQETDEDKQAEKETDNSTNIQKAD